MQTAAVIIVNAILLCFSLYVECVLRRAVWFMGYSHSLVVVFSTAACTMLARRPSCCKPQTLQQSGRWWLWVGRRQCGARTSCRSRRMISATVPAELSLCFVNDSMFLLLFICALATQPLAIWSTYLRPTFKLQIHSSNTNESHDFRRDRLSHCWLQ